MSSIDKIIKLLSQNLFTSRSLLIARKTIKSNSDHEQTTRGLKHHSYGVHLSGEIIILKKFQVKLFLDIRIAQLMISLLKMSFTNESLDFGNDSTDWTHGTNGTLFTNISPFADEPLVSKVFKVLSPGQTAHDS